MFSPEQQAIIDSLQANWVWTPDWIDGSSAKSAGRVVDFTRRFRLAAQPSHAVWHFSADTRYKLYINGVRVAVGPSRSSRVLWYYDTLDVAPHLRVGDNEVRFQVVRYFATVWGAFPFERTLFPGLTVSGSVETRDHEVVDISSRHGWTAQVDESLQFPMDLADDCLHIYERITPTHVSPPVKPVAWGITSLNGGLPPWRLRPRVIPMPEETPVAADTVRSCKSAMPSDAWSAYLSGKSPLTLPGDSTHTVDVQAEVHSTAFLRWVLQASKPSNIHLKITYSEGYELKSDTYPFFRNKADRLDATNGLIIGPYDDVTLDLSTSEPVAYEPFWFRTFRLMRVEITVGENPVTLVSFNATQVNYPMAVKAAWNDPGDAQGDQLWEVSIRTLRNCMFDGYSDCPYYEQLHRSVGLFHYLLSGDDRLMRQTLTTFAASVTFEGLTQSRFPCQAPQLIAGFPLYWILQVCDHHLYFGDTAYTKSFLPRIDGVLDFFDAHVDHLGLVSGLPADVWQYVDWVTTWGATANHPDKGVPTAGRKSNRHTYFSMLYAYVLRQAAQLVRQVRRPAHAAEYESRADALVTALRTHCYDGQFFTDSTADIAGDDDAQAYSQHCQVFALLCGAALPSDGPRLLTASFGDDARFAKCSYVMRFYALRAFALAGDAVYEAFYPQAWDPWRKMLRNNLSTWEEDDVRHRSDCHAWGSVPVYEFCTEVAGVQPVAPGCSAVLFKPRVRLSAALSAKVALGNHNVASVSWTTEADGEKHITLRLEAAVALTCQLPGQPEQDLGVTDCATLVYKA
ncbi:rhamnosidase B [Niveomyces insectorum RCEF 264]|uniref:Rhamnosidase B n=1 Tax=Niveomyces insectorum RCEF 264 TaxID=1081102 RepID=A0A167UX93_9HYPO|nr:rhamnosidase B [Niveomyces insectorum RCEF 264]